MCERVNRGRKGKPLTGARVGDRVNRMPSLMIAAIRMMISRVGVLFSQHLDGFTQFIEFVILKNKNCKFLHVRENRLFF